MTFLPPRVLPQSSPYGDASFLGEVASASADAEWSFPRKPQKLR
jgi:hypothetical protein